MSKMSDIHLALDEQACELGFCGVEDALEQGWQVDYEAAKLTPPTVQPTADEMKELERGHELAHQQWLAKRSATLADLYALYKIFKDDQPLLSECAKVVKKAIDFIEEKEV